MKVSAYSPKEICKVMESMKAVYAIVRLVDPEECRELFVDADGSIGFGERCFSIWKADQRCADCVSFRASHAWQTLSKVKKFDGRRYNITSVPVRIQTNNGLVSCNMELGALDMTHPGEKVRRNGDAGDTNSADYLLTHDVLTGLLNMEGFSRAARQILIDYPQEQFVILAGNISRFKVLNSLYGRAYGDSVLISLSRELERDKGICTLFARDGADGFLVLKRKQDASARWLNGRLAEIEKKFSTPEFLFAFHIGIYEIEDASLPMSVMVSRATIAVRSSRNSGMERVTAFSSDMLKNQLHEQQVIGSFAKTMEEGRFLMYLQPQVRTDGSFIGAEALARAVREDGSIIPPDEFIGILERSSQIYRLDLFIWECAVKELQKWARMDGSILQEAYISVNVSPTDLYIIDVPQTLHDLCARYGVDPSRLHVEITETSVLDDIEKRAGNMDRLQELGFCVEIDDFGKGSSSLAMLSQSNANVLKVDRSFLYEIQNSRRAFQILRAVIDLTEHIGMNTIVEGVETKEQLQILTDMGCSAFQGFYFSKPLPAEKLTASFVA